MKKLLLGICAVVLGFSATFVAMDTRPRQASQTAPNVTVVARSDRLPPGPSYTVRQGRDGMLKVTASLSGTPMTMIVDTGATYVAIGRTLAKQLSFAEKRGKLRVTTANGSTDAEMHIVNELAVGGFVAKNVEIAVHPELDVALLGMNFLSKFRWSYENGQLTIR